MGYSVRIGDVANRSTSNHSIYHKFHSKGSISLNVNALQMIIHVLVSPKYPSRQKGIRRWTLIRQGCE